MTEATDMAKEHTGLQLGPITTCLLGVQTGTETAGGLVDTAVTVSMIMRLPMQGTMPGRSTLHVALMHILDNESQMVQCTVICLQSLHTMKAGGAEAGTLHLQKMVDRHPMQTGCLHIPTCLPPMLTGPHPMLKGDHPMWKGHPMQRDHGLYMLSRSAGLRSQHTDPCQQWNIPLS